MRTDNWMRRLLAARRLSRARRDRRRSASQLVPWLSVKRLEERRVLNADAAPVEVLVVHAGDAANDGQADTYQVQLEADHVQVRVNGEITESVRADEVAAIHIRGSADDDVLVADLLAGVDLRFDSGAGHDQLLLNSDTRFAQVSYELTGSFDGEVQTRATDLGGDTSIIRFRDVERVVDRLTSDDRTFHLQGDGGHVTLDAGRESDDSTQLTHHGQQNLVLQFVDPRESLRLETRGTAETSAFLVEVHALRPAFEADLQITGSPYDALDLGDSVHLESGNLSVTTGSILVSGAISSHHAQIDLHAYDSLVVDSHAQLRSDLGIVRMAAPRIVVSGELTVGGGLIELDSMDQGITTVAGRIDASQSAWGFQGGTVHLLGGKVELLAGARIEASGAHGGGTVLVGGGRYGSDPAVRNARLTSVATQAEIRADARIAGAGGTVVLWSDEATRFAGLATARGGVQGGDGGFVEISGKESLVFTGWADAAASGGRSGTLLLDPANIVIHDAADGLQADDGALPDLSNATVGAPGAFSISETALEALAAASNLVLEATNNITLNNLADNALTLPTTAAGSVTFRANSDGVGGGSFVMQGADDTIVTAGSSVLFSGTSVTLGSVSANGGTVTINNSAASTVTGVISGAGGLVKDGAGVLTLSGNNTYSGTTTVNAGRLNVTGALNAASSVTINGQADADLFVADRNGSNLRVQMDASVVLDTPFAQVASLRINGLAGNDRLTIDHSAGFLDVDVVYDGGAAGNDKLVVRGDGANDTANYTPGATGAGVVTVADDGGGNSMSVSFTNLEPVDITGMLTATLTTPGAVDVLTLTNGTDAATGLVPALVVAGTSAGTTIETAHFFGNTNVVIDADNLVGADTITVASANNGAFTNLTIASGGSIDGVTDDGVADIAGATITLSAALGGIGNMAVLDVAATTRLDATTASGDNSNIQIDSIGNLNVGLVTAGTGNVTLDSTGDIDSVTDNAVADIVGATVTLLAAVGGIGNASVLDVTATTRLDADTVTGDDANIRIDSIGNLNVGLVSAGTGNVTLDSTGDIDSVTDNAVADVVGATVTLLAAVGGIGNASVLDVTATTRLDADTVTGDDANIQIDSIGNLNVGLVSAGTGNVTLDSTGDIDSVTDNAVADVVGATVTLLAAVGGIGNASVLDVTATTRLDADTVTGDDANIRIDSIGNLNVGLVSAGTGNVTLDSTGDIDSVTDDAVADVVGGTVTLLAAVGGIGNTSALDVAATSRLNADTVTGDDANIRIDGIGNLPLGLVTAGTGNVILTATAAIVDSPADAAVDVVAANATFTATSIGTVTAFGMAETGNNSEDAGQAIELMISGSLTAATTATGGVIHVVQSGNLEILAGQITITGTGQAILQTTGNLDAGDAGSIALTGGDNLALLAGGTLTVPTLGFTTTGNLRLVGGVDVRAEVDGDLPFTAGDLYFRSGAAAGDETLNTDVTSLSARVTTNDIVINETSAVNIGRVEADAGDATINTGGAINSLNDNAVADVVAQTVTLAPTTGGIGNSSVLDVTATTRLNANTAVADNANIQIDSIGDLPVGLVSAGTGNVTLDSTGDIDSIADDAVADVVGANVALLAAVGGIGNDLVLDVTATTRLDANTVAGDDGNIQIDSIGNLAAGLITAGTGNVTLDSTGDIDSVTDDAVADVVGANLTLFAAVGGIGNTSVLDVTATTRLDANTAVADNANIQIDSIGDLPVGLVSAGTGNVTLDSTADIDSVTDDAVADVVGANVVLRAAAGGIGNDSVLDVTATTRLDADTDAGDDGNLLIDSIGDLPVGLVTAGTGSVTLDSTGDINSLADDAVADVVGGTITLAAAVGGIGNTSVVDVAATTAVNANTAAGDNANIQLDSIGDLPVGLVTAGTGNVTLDSTGDIDGVTDDAVADVVGATITLLAAVGGIGTTSPLDVTATTRLDADTAAGDDGNLLIDSIGDLPVGLVTAGTGNVTLDSTGRIDSLADDAVADVVGGTITLVAAVGGIGNTTVVDLAATTAVNADTTVGDDANIQLDSIGDLPVGLVSAGTGNVTLDSTGDIDSVADDGVADVVGATITLLAAVGGIGNASALEVSANTRLDANTAVADNANIQIDSIGNLPAGLVTAGTGNVSLDSTGDIDSVTDDATADVVGSTITLMAAAGGIGNTSVLDVTATTTLNASTAAGDNANIQVDSIGDLPTGLVTAGTGDVTLDSTGDIDSVNDDAVADVVGGTITLRAAVGGIGNGSVVDVTAATALNADTAAGDAADIQIDSVGDLPVGAVTAGTGNVALESTAAITDGGADAAADIAATEVRLNAVTGIGLPGVGRELDTSVARLAAAGGTGGAFVRNSAALEIGNVAGGVLGVTANGPIEIATNAGSLTVQELVQSNANNVALTGATTATLNANVNATSGTIRVAAGNNAIDAIVIGGATLNASGGSVSSNLLAFVNIAGVGPRLTALDSSNDMSPQQVTTGTNARIDVQITEAAPGAVFQVEIDWRESNNAVLPIGIFPGSVLPVTAPNVLARVVESTLAGTPPEGMFEHTYFANPDGPSPVIYVPIRISQIAGGTIDLVLAGTDLEDFSQGAGSLRDNDLGGTLDFDNNGSPDAQVGIMTVIALAVLPPTVGDIVPIPEALPAAPPLTIPAAALAAPPPLVTPNDAGPALPNTTGLTGQAEIRFYQLRIVSFNEAGELVETPDQRIDLNDSRLQAIAPFDPSKLPELFKRLPGDRYRIYLIEDGAERLILEFVIEQVGGEGRPVELPERVEAQPPAELPPPPPIDNPAADAGAATRGVDPVMLRAVSQRASDTRPAAEFVDRLGRTPLVSSGGLLFGATLYGTTARLGRVARADRRMASFRKRQRDRGMVERQSWSPSHSPPD
jgi:autotransporter-associated beta strand protein